MLLRSMPCECMVPRYVWFSKVLACWYCTFSHVTPLKLPACTPHITCHNSHAHVTISASYQSAGDTPRRRGFIDALQLGCIPVVFSEASRTLPLFLSNHEIRDASVLLDAASLDDPLGPNGIFSQLRARLPDAPRRRAAVAAAVTRLHYAYGELTAEDHDTVGPDALDMMLYGLAAPARNWPSVNADDLPA